MEVPQPRTLGELQLFRLLERANLLSYYSTFVEQGGDDVQQLVDAGEDEFLEIMALVGMASKPLHVRRLQKALQEWVNNPTVFLQPASSLPSASIPISRLAGLAATASALPGRTAALAQLSVNEAAFQLCLRDPALLTRRDELFPLARQVVRDSGYRYSHRQSRARGSDSLSPKRMKLDGDNSQDAHSPPQLELEGGKADGRCSEGSVSGEAPSRDGGSECSSGEDGHDDDEGQASGSSRPHSPPSPSNTESGGLGGLAGLCEGLGLALRARCQGESNHTNHNIKVEAAWADSEATVADCGFQTCPVKIEPASPE
uniref:NGFI-A-binding protein 1-like isoform X2 n=1 Tax=Myxine glutinosa TaxID=7769 RepID=UPI00358E4C13